MIHCFQNNGFNIVMDVDSGAIHVVDDLVYGMIPIIEPFVVENVGDPHTLTAALWEMLPQNILDRYSRDEIFGAVCEILELYKSGSLFSKTSYQEVVQDYADRETVVKALCLHVAHDCNLSCKYCFAGEGEYHGERSLMSYETGVKALDFLVKSSGNRVNLEVDFFGGEPLMNWEVVKKLVAYGRGLEKEHNKLFRFTLTTNGVLLNDEIIEFLNREMHNVVLSIDGRREVHDRMRPFRGGQGSFDTVMPKLQDFAKRRGRQSYYVRGTYTHHNTDFSEDVLFLADQGFDSVSVEPVVAPEDADYALTKQDIPVLLEQYDILASEMDKRRKEGRGFTFFHFMLDLKGGPCVYKRLSGCGSGTEYLSVTPEGDLYPCHQFAGEEDFLLGNVDTGITNTKLVDSFKKCNVFSREKCRSCFARFHCSGGCAANAYHATGRIDGVYEAGCELQKKRIECAIMLQASEAGLKY